MDEATANRDTVSAHSVTARQITYTHHAIMYVGFTMFIRNFHWLNDYYS